MQMTVTDVSIIPPSTSVGQSTAIYVTITNEGSQQEENVSVKAFVDGSQVVLTQYGSLYRDIEACLFFTRFMT